MSETTKAIAWTCQHCHEPIADGKGWITIERSDAYQHAREVKEWRASLESPHCITGAELRDLPDKPRWNITHSTCDEVEDVTGYTIDIERIRTERDLLSWTVHLMDKKWLSDTDWPRVIRKAIGRVHL